MKTKIVIEIETPDDPQVWEDYEKSEEDYTKEELKNYREKFAKGFHNALIGFLERQAKEDLWEDFVDSSFFDEYAIENWEEADDYGVKMSFKRDRNA